MLWRRRHDRREGRDRRHAFRRIRWRTRRRWQGSRQQIKPDASGTSCRQCIDRGVQAFVAPAVRQHPHPIWPAFPIARLHHFRRQLREILGVEGAADREVDIAGTGFLNSQPAVDYILRGVDADHENPRVAPGPAGADRPYRTRPGNALDRQHAAAAAVAAISQHLVLMVAAAIDTDDAHAQFAAGVGAVGFRQHAVQQVPDLALRRIAGQHFVAHRPAFPRRRRSP